MEALARQGLDRSLVYRWFRNERVPGLGSGHCERIARCLGFRQEDFDRLIEAQVESLRTQARQSVRRGGQGGLGRGPVETSNVAEETGAGYWSPRPARAASGVGVGVVQWAPDVLLQNAIAMMGAVSGPDPEKRDVLLTYQSHDTFDALPDRFGQWLAAVRSALDRGFDLVHLLRLDGDTDRWSRIVEYILGLTGAAGRYRPYYFNMYGVDPRGYDLLVVPGVAACLALATEQPGRIGAALVTSSPQEIDLLRAHFAVLQGQTRPLFRSFAESDGPLEWLNVLARAEDREGDLYAVGLELSPRTEPYSWHSRALGWLDSAGSLNLQALAEPRKRRLDSFYRHVESYRFREICPRSAVLRLARTGESISLGPNVRLSPADRMAHLENLIALLNTFENYELALPTESEDRAHLSGCSWQVKCEIGGENVVHIDAPVPGKGGSRWPTWLETREPTVAAAFRRHFSELFEHRISPPSRNKREVILFLESQLQWLRRHHRDELRET